MLPIHLHVHSAYSFLDGCSYPEGITERVRELGYPAVAITDHNNLSGAVRFVKAAAEEGIKPILGSEVTLDTPSGEAHITLLAIGATGYENLCRLITAGFMEGGRTTPAAPRDLLQQFSDGLFALSGCRKGEVARHLLKGDTSSAADCARWYRSVFGERYFIEMQRLLLPHEDALLARQQQLADALNIPTVATANVHYLQPMDMPTHDILTCIRKIIRVDDADPARPLNCEQYLLPPETFRQRFHAWPQALENTRIIADACRGDILTMSRPDIPKPAICFGEPKHYLRKLTIQGAEERYGKPLPHHVQKRLDHELRVIGRLRCEEYFLTIWDIVREARSRGVRISGRGSVVDSAVGYCLGVSGIDPISANLMFERFMSPERSQLPDIDIDFPREERDMIVQWIQERYGHDHVGGVCTFSTFRGRAALREVGKAMGFPLEEIGVLAKRLRRTNADEIAESIGHQPQIANQSLPAKRYMRLFELCARVAGLPRHMSTHLAGVVITANPILRYTPLQPTAKGVIRITHFDKDDIEHVGLKTDILSLPMLGVMRNTEHVMPYDLIPEDDDDTFRMIRSGESIGAFELQSPAQRALHSRMATSTQKDIIDSIALIRPGPGMGGMVDNYIKRRLGLEPVTYLHASLEEPLKDTYGVVVFQEQVMEVACAAAKMTPGEADILRKYISHARSKKAMDSLREGFIQRAVENGLDYKAAEKVFSVIASFVGYGFAEGHARAFAHIAYRSCYLLRNHPSHYLAGVLNNQPMGFYSPNTLISQARLRGVRILPLDVNRSDYFFSATEDDIRVGFRQVRGLSEKLGNLIPQKRPYSSVYDFCYRCRPSIDELQSLISAGAFDSLHMNRRALLWQSEPLLRSATRPDAGEPRLLDAFPQPPEGIIDFSDTERLSLEFAAMGMTVECHVMSLMRPKFDALGLLSTQDLMWMPDGQQVKAGGLVLYPHTPPTKSGHRVLFFCLEDEFGLMDVTCFQDVYESSGYLAFSHPVLMIEGIMQIRGLGRSLLAKRVRAVPKTVNIQDAIDSVLKLPEPKMHASAR